MADCSQPLLSDDGRIIFGDTAFEHFKHHGLLVETQPAESVACQECMEDHHATVHAILDQKPSRWFHHCPTVGIVHVDPTRLKRWRIDRGRLATFLRQSLAAAGECRAIQADCVWRLGVVSISNSRFSGYLVIGLIGDKFQALLNSMSELRAKNALIFVSGEMNLTISAGSQPPLIVLLNDCFQFDGRCFTVDQEYLQSLTSTDSKLQPSLQHFQTPAGTLWKDVTLEVEDHHLVVKVQDVMRRYEYSEIGFLDRRGKSKPNQCLRLLRLFARFNGKLSDDQINDIKKPDSKKTDIRNSITELRDLLNSLLQIEQNPIIKQSKGPYQARFRIRAAFDQHANLPPGTNWYDLTVRYLDANQFEILVLDKEIHCLFTAFHADSRMVDHFRELLTSRGRFSATSNDPSFIKFEAALRQFFQIDSSPFEQANSRSWKALFEVESQPRS